MGYDRTMPSRILCRVMPSYVARWTESDRPWKIGAAILRSSKVPTFHVEDGTGTDDSPNAWVLAPIIICLDIRSDSDPDLLTKSVEARLRSERHSRDRMNQARF